MLKRACEWAKIQRQSADSMRMAWPRSSLRWKQMLREYKEGTSKLNPFEEPDPGKYVCMYLCPLELNAYR